MAGGVLFAGRVTAGRCRGGWSKKLPAPDRGSSYLQCGSGVVLKTQPRVHFFGPPISLINVFMLKPDGEDSSYFILFCFTKKASDHFRGFKGKV